MPETPLKVWSDGRLIDWDNATVHVTAHVVNYGSAVFDGMRCYNTIRGPHIFRLRDHLRRLLNSCKIYQLDIPYSIDDLEAACLELVRANKLFPCYIRPIVLRGMGAFGVDPTNSKVEAFIVSWSWGAYLADDALESGVKACVSSWTRIAPNTLPAIAKSAANYMNSQLIKLEAIRNGYAEGIALDDRGAVSEGSAENLFLVYGGTLVTPPLVDSVLPGITRNSILTISQDLKIPVEVRSIAREELYIADELILVGTATEITPVISVDRRPVGTGTPGPITRRLQEEFLGIVNGRIPDRYGWLTPVSVSDEPATNEMRMRTSQSACITNASRSQASTANSTCIEPVNFMVK